MKVAYLSGGVGGARLLLGLCRAMPAPDLTAVVNTGDDFEHWGLHVSPDLDTVMYTLAGLSDFERGWGLRDESFGALSMVQRYGGEDWFQLGDRDLGTHLMRSERLRRGQSLTAITRALCASLGVEVSVLPMTDAPVQTVIESVDGRALPFQHWFVRERCAPTVRAVRLQALDPAQPPRPTTAVTDALRAADLVLLGPSNPFVSIDPILDLPGVRALVAERPCVAVSPIVAGRAVKGPLTDMLPSIAGVPASAASVARHYPGLRGFVVQDGDEVDLPGVAIHPCETLMTTPARSEALAREVLAFASELLP